MKYFRILEVLLYPITYLASIYLRFLRGRLKRLPLSERIFMNVGLLPVTDHFYQPLINPRKYLNESLRKDRELPGIDWNADGQLKFLSQFRYNQELLQIPQQMQEGKRVFYYENTKFTSGDAEYYYNLIRLVKPARIIEIGSGMSTLLALSAVRQNEIEDPSYNCSMICVEPYQNFWLESLEVRLIKKRVEELPLNFFEPLTVNDILFIDSSHIIRPQGDVLFEYLKVLPSLRSGVFVHVHDIFSPKDYLDEWVLNDHKLWNEQYLLEAFLSCNRAFEIVGALNYLHHNYKDQLFAKSPILAMQPSREPGSFWFRKV